MDQITEKRPTIPRAMAAGNEISLQGYVSPSEIISLLEDGHGQRPIQDETATINETPKPKDKQPVKGFVQEKAIRWSQLTDNADYSVAYQVYANNVCRTLSLQAQINRAKAVHAQTNNVDDTIPFKAPI